MLRGRFEASTGRPYFEAHLLLRRLKLAADVSFLLDTGADVSVVMPLDGSRIGIPYGALGKPVDVVTAGGAGRGFIEPVLIAFTAQDGTLYVYGVDVHIWTPGPELAGVPSLIGRDILDNWRITYDRLHNDLEAKVLRADAVVPAR